MFFSGSCLKEVEFGEPRQRLQYHSTVSDKIFTLKCLYGTIYLSCTAHWVPEEQGQHQCVHSMPGEYIALSWFYPVHSFPLGNLTCIVLPIKVDIYKSLLSLLQCSLLSASKYYCLNDILSWRSQYFQSHIMSLLLTLSPKLEITVIQNLLFPCPAWSSWSGIASEYPSQLHYLFILTSFSFIILPASLTSTLFTWPPHPVTLPSLFIHYNSPKAILEGCSYLKASGECWISSLWYWVNNMVLLSFLSCCYLSLSWSTDSGTCHV